MLVPLARNAGWRRAKDFASGVARVLERRAPGRFTTRSSKDERPGKIFLDTGRNARGQTAVAAYSPRAKAGASVSMPVSWEALAGLESSKAFSVATAPDHIARRGSDPWERFSRTRQQLTESRCSALEALLEP